jgi:hypothetical protein
MGMKTKIVVMLVIIMAMFLLSGPGCGGGSGGGGGLSSNMPGGSIVNVPQPAPAPTLSPLAGTPLGSRGYVYVSSARGGAKVASGQIIVLPTAANPPDGFVPAVGYLVRSSLNPYVYTRTDSNGYFDLSFAAGTTSSSTASIIVQDPSSQAGTVSYPVIGSPMPCASLTNVKIVPPFSGSSQAEWSLYAGQCDTFFLVGFSGNEWHPVSDTVTWSVSDATMGAFTGTGLFTASDSLSATTSGTIAAACGGLTFTVRLKVVPRGSVGSIQGYVKDDKGNPAANVMIDTRNPGGGGDIPAGLTSGTATGSSGSVPGGMPVIPYGIAVTDNSGFYRISNLPYDTYTITVSSLSGTTLASDSVAVSGPVTKDFTITGSVYTLFAMVSTDQFAYTPGSTIKAKITVLNTGAGAVNVTYGAIQFTLVNSDIFLGTSTTVSTVTAPGGTVTIPPFGQAVFPQTAVSLSVPQSSDSTGHYSVAVSFTSTPVIKANQAEVMIGDLQSLPTPTPTTTVTPSPVPTPTPTTTTPPSNNDYYVLREIRYRLQDAYSNINSYANSAYYGEDVSSYVNESSSLQYNLKYVRNYYMPSLKTVNYWNWQNEIDSVLNDLNRYAYYGGTPSDLYTAANSDNYLLNEVSYATDTISSRIVKKRAGRH